MTSTNDWGSICGTASHTFSAHRVTSAWSLGSTSNQITHDTVETAPTFTLAASSPSGWMNWEVAPTVRKWLSTGADAKPSYGLLVKRTTEPLDAGGPMAVSSENWEHVDKQPTLEVTWASDAVKLFQPITVHSDGADLSWMRWDGSTGNPFGSYDIHRSATAGFTPSDANRIARITDPDVVAHRDTTAAPSTTVSYKIVVNSTVSNEQTVTLPAAGLSRLSLQLGKTDKSSFIEDDTAGSCLSYGHDQKLWVGDSDWPMADRALVQFPTDRLPAGASLRSATLSLYSDGYASSDPTITTLSVSAHRVTKSWEEGTGGGPCIGDGATWTNAASNDPWAQAGGDFVSNAAGAPVTHADGEAPGWHNWDVKSIAQAWANRNAANQGILLKVPNDRDFAGAFVSYHSDDAVANATLRPKLEVVYIEPGVYTWAEARALGLSTAPTPAEAGLPECPADTSGWSGFDSADDADVAEETAPVAAACAVDPSADYVEVGQVAHSKPSFTECLTLMIPCRFEGYHWAGLESAANYGGVQARFGVVDPVVQHRTTDCLPGGECGQFVAARALLKGPNAGGLDDRGPWLEAGWIEIESFPRVDPLNRQVAYTGVMPRGADSNDDFVLSYAAKYPLVPGKAYSFRVANCGAGVACAYILWQRNGTYGWELLRRHFGMNCENTEGTGTCAAEAFVEVFSGYASAPHPHFATPGAAVIPVRKTRTRSGGSWSVWNQSFFARQPADPNVNPYYPCAVASPPGFNVQRAPC